MIRKFFLEFDMFPALPTFRMRGEPETLSLFGGIISVMLLLFFLYIFIINALDIINFREIKARVVNQVA